MTEYIKKWEACGYSDGIPDEAPSVLVRLGLAPSYKAIACAILKNDLNLLSLGFQGEYSEWYGILKREELDERFKNSANYQHSLI
tara:strand:+ start:998 stop:1252 length:255 start_codon:yes stop_codon:yes gene_type:complete